jgi:hypothetical protein
MVLSTIRRAFFLPVFLYLRPKLIKHYGYANGLINLYFFGSITHSLFAFNEAFMPMLRMAAPFTFIEVLLLPAILKLFKRNYTKHLFLVFLFFYGLMKYASTLATYPTAYIPYRSIFGTL